MQQGKRHRSRWWAVVIVLAATVISALLRFWGIKWGLPDEFHQFTYHPDEIFQVAAMLRVDLAGLQLDPGFYNYPSGYINLGSFILSIISGYGLSTGNSMTGVYLIGRSISAVLGILTVPVVYWVGTRLYGRTVGILASVIFALMPLHAIHSHFATVDVTATFWVAVALAASAIILSKPTWKVYLAAGLAAGIAAGTKYNAALVFLPIIMAYVLKGEDGPLRPRLRDIRLWVGIAGLVIGFIIATPAILIEPSKFTSGFMFEMKHAASGHGLVFEGREPRWFDMLVISMGYGLGVPMLFAILASIGLALVRRRPADWLLLSFLIPYYLLISFSEVRFARYAMPMLPALAVLAARLMTDVYVVLREHAHAVLRWGWIVLSAGAVVYTGIYAAACIGLFTDPDPRTSAAEWFESNVQPGTMVAVPTVPWFYSPPLSPRTTAVRREDRFNAMAGSNYNLVTNLDVEWDPAIIQEENPHYVVITDYEYEDPLRLNLPDATKYISLLDRSYIQVAGFSKRVSISGIDFGPAERLPHDLKYAAPTIKVYKRK